MHNLHPQNAAAKGILGRAVSALLEQASPYSSYLYSLIGRVKMVEGDETPDYIDPYNGVIQFSQHKQLNESLGNLTQFISESVFCETYSSLLRSSLAKTQALGQQLSTTTLNTTFLKDYVSQELLQVSKLIKLRSTLQTERAVFVIQAAGFDTHNTFDLTKLFGSIDAALNSFSKEMKIQGIWDDVAVLTVSEFGRTLTANGGGTDHAWAGNHFLAGGKVKGGKILGTYPDTLTDSGALNIGRGRIIPTMSWEAVWKGLVQWFGVEDDKLSFVLPNMGNFPEEQLFTKDDLFLP